MNATVVSCLPVAVAPGSEVAVLGVVLTPGPAAAGWSRVVTHVRGQVSPAVAVTDLSGPAPRSVSGIGESTFGWTLGRLDGPPLPAAPAVLQAFLPLKSAPREIELTIRVDMSFARRGFALGRRPLDHHRIPRLWQFRLVAPARRPLKTGQPRVRLCLAADIERYSRFANSEAMLAQERLLEVLRQARTHAGVDESAVLIEGAGDSQFAILPDGLDEATVVPLLLEGVAKAMREVNRGLDRHERLRIRMAMDRGLLTPSVNGWVGGATIAVHRMLDSPPLRAALTVHDHADHVVMVSRTLFRDVIRHGCDGFGPFAEIDVDIPGKGFSERAWLFVPE
ncbi:hypothetical protein [Kutzneria sp. NPDC052558]|uniref:hypothetical protein n=1 Tax=Kutzneria sp. NPDC052558 TaxID=3364121 RepID=UPI0037C61B1D